MGNKVHVGPELIRPNQVVNPVRGLWRTGSEIEMKSSLFNCAWMQAHGAQSLFLDLDAFKLRERLLGL